MFRAVVCALCLAACYSAPAPDCGFICGASGACPEGYTCNSDNVCRRDDAPASVTCEVDAGVVPPDMAFFDAPADADPTPPAVVSTTPADAATDVARTTAITVGFSEPVVNVSATTFTVTTAGGTVAGAITLATPGDYTTYVFTPDAMLDAATVVTVTLTTGIEDYDGNTLPAPVSISFTTGA